MVCYMSFGFSEEHKKRTRDITITVLTVLVLGFLLNLLASDVFQIFFIQFDQTLIMLGIVIVTSVVLSACFALYLLKPPNSFVKVAFCNLLWNTRDAKVLQSVYDYSSGYFPQMMAFQVFDEFEKHRPELKELLKEGIGFPPKNKHVLSYFMDYLMLLWLSLDALKPTCRLHFKEESFQLNDLEAQEPNPIIETAKVLIRQGKAGWTPPDVSIELPKGTKISISSNDRVGPNNGKLTLKNTYCEIAITYRVGAWRASVGSMWAGPAPSVLGMPVNPFFQEYLLRNLSSISVIGYYIVFEAKFNVWLLPIRPKAFYRHMQWAEDLSELFVAFFDWNGNTKLALASRQDEIYQIVKGLELRLGDLEKKLGETKGNASSIK